jgi:hypothetical protein
LSRDCIGAGGLRSVVISGPDGKVIVTAVADAERIAALLRVVEEFYECHG